MVEQDLQQKLNSRWKNNLQQVFIVALLGWSQNLHAQVETPPSSTVSGTAALEHFRVGVGALHANDFDKAVRELTRAVQLEPKAGEYYAALSAALLANDQIHVAWKSARRAVALGPQNPRCMEQLAAAWMALGRDVAFRVATQAAAVESTLGKPDRVNIEGENERWIYGFYAVDFAKGRLFSTTDLRGKRPVAIDNVQLGYRPDPDAWRVRYRTRDQFGFTSEYEPSDQDKSSPSEVEKTNRTPAASEASPLPMIVVQRIYDITKQGVSPRDWLERNRTASLSSNDTWKLLHEDLYGLIFEHTIRGPDQRVTSWEISRLLKGPRDLFRVSYIAKAKPDDTEVGRWRETWSDTRLVKPKKTQ